MTPDLVPARTALLLIDCQVDFGAPDGEMARRGMDMIAVPAALEKASLLLAAARAADVMPVFVRLEASADGGLCVQGTPGADFFGVAPLAGDAVITKRLYSAFSSTNLSGLLKDKGIATLVLAGLTTECCVAATAWAAFEEGFGVVIAADAAAAYDQRLHRATLDALSRSGGAILPAAEIQPAWKNPVKSMS